MQKEGVVLAFINQERDKFFMQERGPGRSHEGEVLFISGSVEKGEEYIETINREVAEELGGEVQVLGVISLNIDPPPISRNGTILRGFLISEYEGELPPFILDTGDPTKWVDVNEAATSDNESVRLIATAAIQIIPHLLHPSSLNFV